MNTRTAEMFFDALTVEKANINTYKTQCGFSNPDVAECQQDHANLEAALANVTIADADKQSVTRVKNAVYNGDVNESVDPYPSFSLTPLPHPDVKAGALSRYNNRKGRAKLAAGYTDQIGIAMGYAGEPAGSVSPDSVKPTITVEAAQTDYLFSVVVANRAESDMWDVFTLRKGAADWVSAGRFTGKSADITITPTTPGNPEQIQVRVQLRKSNQNYGQASDIVYVTVNP